METSLEEIDTIVLDEVDHPMLLRESARPHAGSQVLQRLGLSDAAERVAQNGFDEIEHAQSHLAVGLNPMS